VWFSKKINTKVISFLKLATHFCVHEWEHSEVPGESATL
jgi:hypothetical protein